MGRDKNEGLGTVGGWVLELPGCRGQCVKQISCCLQCVEEVWFSE